MVELSDDDKREIERLKKLVNQAYLKSLISAKERSKFRRLIRKVETS